MSAAPDGPPVVTPPAGEPVVAPGAAVRLHLAIRLADGTVALSSFDDAPLAFRVGDGTLAPGLEALLLGLPAGADQVILADGDLVFGPWDAGSVQVIDRRDLPADFEAAPGDVVSFSTPAGQQTAGTVLEVTDAGLRVDLNHPLASRGLAIQVRVLAVEPAGCTDSFRVVSF